MFLKPVSCHLLHNSVHADIGIVHWVEKRVVRATPCQVGEDSDQGKERKSRQEQDNNPAKRPSSSLSSRLHHCLPPPQEPVSGRSPLVLLLPAIWVAGDERGARKVAQLASTSSVGRIEVHYSFLFSVSLGHLRFPRRSWGFRCRSGFGLVLTFGGGSRSSWY